MDVTQLRYFLVTAQLEHVTQAARKLSIAQPALSQSIHRLESELDVKLFARQGRNLKLTEEGAYLRDHLAPIVAQLDTVREAVGAFSKLREHTVRLCIATASVITVDALALFATSHPEIDFEARQNDDSQDSDIIISTHDAQRKGKPTYEDRWGPACFVERICVAVPASSDFAERKAVHLSELVGERFISLAGSKLFRSICDDLCAREGFAPHVSFESDNPAVVRKMIALGLGVGFWPQYSWGEIDEDEVRVIPFADSGFERRLQIAITPDGIEKEAVRTFYEFLREHFERVWNKGRR